MSGNTIADLVVLGIIYRSSVAQERLPGIARSIVPDLWSPTSDVIGGAVLRNLESGFLILSSSLPSTLALTETGGQQFQKLMAFEANKNEDRLSYALEAIQFCFLDGAPRSTAKTVLEHQHARISARLIELQERCQRCPYDGHYTRLWMGMERRRLEVKAEFIAIACRECSNDLGRNDSETIQ